MIAEPITCPVEIVLSPESEAIVKRIERAAEALRAPGYPISFATEAARNAAGHLLAELLDGTDTNTMPRNVQLLHARFVIEAM